MIADREGGRSKACGGYILKLAELPKGLYQKWIVTISERAGDMICGESA